MSCGIVTSARSLFILLRKLFVTKRDMSPLVTIQKTCFLVLLLITWDTCVSSQKGNHSLHIWLGCRVLIPCQPHNVSSDSFKWFYKKREHSEELMLFFQDKSGITLYASHHRKVTDLNRSLDINNFKEDDQGIYWCQNCYKNVCKGERLTIFSVHKEILTETRETVYIAAGSSFTRTCSGDFPDLKWTFEGSNKNAQKFKLGPEMVTGTTEKLIHITNVKNTDAGKYTCWASRCGGPAQKLLTVNLCVIKAHTSEDSSPSCSVTCDVGPSNMKNTLSLLINNTRISMDVDPFGNLTCNASQISDSYTTVTSKYVTWTVFNITADESEETDHLFPVIYGIPSAIACLTVLALLIFCMKSRLCAAVPFPSCCGCRKQEEEDFTVIYSSVLIKTPPERIRDAADSECLYSEIKV